ncbi:MAG: 1-acyl-sn-glycerol-3-phosphate acyltransferase, partial [Pseudomonadota bacterium]
LNIPVIPVALNSGLLWQKNAFIKKPGKITIEFLPAIEIGLKNREFLEHLRNKIEDNQKLICKT